MVTGNGASVADVAELVRGLHQQGVQLWIDAGQLRYRAPQGTLDPLQLERLRSVKAQVIDWLERADGVAAEPPLRARLPGEPIPLTYSQLARWHLLQSGDMPPLRQVATALRLRGTLDVRRLRMCVDRLLERHEALRTQIAICEGTPTQQIVAIRRDVVQVGDITHLRPAAREGEALRIVQEIIVTPVDLARDPLLCVHLLKLADRDHVLVLAMEHVISDGASLAILTRELFALYSGQNEGGAADSLPHVAIQFADYAMWQAKSEGWWLQAHGRYWDDRLRGCDRVRFPADPTAAARGGEGWCRLTLEIDADERARLLAWCRLRRTTLPIAIFTAYCALALRWCNSFDCVIRYQSDGRNRPEIDSTIGFFASSLHLRVQMTEQSTFVDLLDRVMQEYCRAYQHADHTYMESRQPRPELTRNTAFNWIPQPALPNDLAEEEGGLAVDVFRFEHPMLKRMRFDHEPTVAFYDGAEALLGEIYFPLEKLSKETMERFSRNLLLFIRAMSARPERRIVDMPMCE